MELVPFPGKKQNGLSAIEALEEVLKHLREIKEEEGIDYSDITLRVTSEDHESAAMFTTNSYGGALVDSLMLQDHFLGVLRER